MRNATIIAAAVGALVAACSTAHALPFFDENEVFVGGMDDVNTYRIPSAVVTSNGTVLVFCEARRDSTVDGSPTHLALKRSLGNAGKWNPPIRRGHVPDTRSRDRNMMWEPMQILVKTDGDSAYMNPVPVIDKSSGRIFLLVDGHDRQDGQRRSFVWMWYSDDEGATWTGPKDITDMTGRKALGPGVGIQMTTGRLVVPTYDGVIFSDDHGQTWKSGGESTPRSETQVVELVDGALMLNIRGDPFRSVCLSKDGGMTWSESYRDEQLVESSLWGGCQATILRYTRKDQGYAKDRLLFANPADKQWRMSPTVRVSYDEGKTWPVSKLIKEGTAAYSCLCVFPDDSIGLVYETGRNYPSRVEYYAKLSFARFNLEWLTDGKDELVKTAAPAEAKPAAEKPSAEEAGEALPATKPAGEDGSAGKN
jgi:sialidase-1